MALLAPVGKAAPWQPNMRAAKTFATHRHGSIAFAVRTQTAAFGWHERRTFPSASVLKAMLLVAYLNEHSVRGRELRPRERALLAPMIRRSDNSAASAVFVQVGTRRLRALARRARMRRFAPAAPVWATRASTRPTRLASSTGSTAWCRSATAA